MCAADAFHPTQTRCLFIPCPRRSVAIALQSDAAWCNSAALSGAGGLQGGGGEGEQSETWRGEGEAFRPWGGFLRESR